MRWLLETRYSKLESRKQKLEMGEEKWRLERVGVMESVMI
jgi:hypothetical protein